MIPCLIASRELFKNLGFALEKVSYTLKKTHGDVKRISNAHEANNRIAKKMNFKRLSKSAEKCENNCVALNACYNDIGNTFEALY